MADVVAFIPDLLFGSRVQATLVQAGHEVVLTGSTDAVRVALSDAAVLVVDLTDEQLDGATLVESLSVEGLLSEVRTLAFYSHVNVQARERAVEAGFDLAVPRSRMAREAEELVAGLV